MDNLIPESEISLLHPILAKYIPHGKQALLPALQDAQKQFGYLSEPVAEEIGRALGVPLADLYGVIDFYAMLSKRRRGNTVIHICCDPVCALEGADEVLDALCRNAGIDPGQVSPDGEIQVERYPCLGLCNHAPAMQVQGVAVGHVKPDQAVGVLTGRWDEPADYVGGSLAILTANCRGEGTTSLEKYQSNGGYQALRKALKMSPEEVIAEVKSAGLLGRGGAAFPAGVKWEAVYKAAGNTKYVVCNADESEPGSFKDRILLEKDPHSTLEGMIIGAYAVSANYGYIYLRGEYLRAHAEIQAALAEARQAGLVGENILGSDFHFEIEIRQGAGAYICGEETALFESIEGKRGFPRMKPPFPTTHGLFGKPTLVNNVETLCNIPFILGEGADKYRTTGTNLSTGPKLFCVSGDVSRPGLYEAPFGIPLRELLFDHAGGIRSGNRLGAVLLGGAAGAFALEGDLDVRLSFEHLKDAGLALGSGAVMVFDETRDVRDVLLRVAHFFAEESCGKCYPCQIGTQRQYEILTRVAAGQTLPGDGLRLADVGWTMTDASLCGLGQTAATAVLSAMQHWPGLFNPSDGDQT